MSPHVSLAQVSVVVCSIDARKFELVSANYRRLLGSSLLEIIGIHDARSLAEGYNRGLDLARGDILVFSHDDIEILSPDFGARLQEHLRRYDLVGIAGTTRLVGGGWYFAGHPFDYMLVISPHPETGRLTMIIEGGGALVVPDIQGLDGVLLATRAPVARALRFDAATFDHFHLYDLDFSYRAYLSGFKVAVCRDLVLVHHSQGKFSDRWDHYRRRFEHKFSGRLAPPLQRRDPRIVNVALGEAIPGDAAQVARLCRSDTLTGFVARLDSMQSP